MEKKHSVNMTNMLQNSGLAYGYQRGKVGWEG